MNLGLGLFLGSRGGGALAPYEPASILSNLVHAYRADRGITLATGKVAQWDDQIGTAHLVQATGANQPAYNAADAGYGNQATIQATTTSQYLAVAAATLRPWTIWIIGQCSTASNVLVSLVPSGSSQPFIGRSAGTDLRLYTGTDLLSGVDCTVKRAMLVSSTAAPTRFIGVDNWVTGGVSDAGATSDGTAIGALAYSNGAFGTVGKLAELIFQAGTPTGTEKTNMAAYVLARYGITVT